MKKVLLFSFVLTIIFFVSATSVNAQQNTKKMTRSEIKSMIGNWPEASQLATLDMMDKYGEPNETTASMLIWYNNGPWKRTVIYNVETKHIFPVDHVDVMEQFIDYKVPADKFDELAMYDGSVTVKRTDGEMSAKCDKEGANFIAINLAVDVINNKKTVEEARNFYAKTIKEFALENKMSDYMKSFQFTMMSKETQDADKHAFGNDVNMQITDAMKKMNREMLEKMKMKN